MQTDVTAPGWGVSPGELDALRARIAADEPAFLADLERLVNIDCGSYTPAGVDEIGRWVAAFMTAAGATVDSFSYGASLTGADGVSMNRSPDASEGGFVLHTSLSSLDASPGRRADGSAF